MNNTNRFVSFPIASQSRSKPGVILDTGRTSWIAIFLCVCYLVCIPATVLAQTQLGSDIDGEGELDYLKSVSLSADGNRLAVGTGQNDGPGEGLDWGHVRVFQWSGTDWTQLGADIDGEAADDWSGEAVSLSGDGTRVAIGAHNNDGNGTNAGHVRVYEWSGTAWLQMGTDIDGQAAFDHYGMFVSFSEDGNRLATAARSQDSTQTDAGQIRIFEWSGADWVQLGDDIYGEYFGDGLNSISLSADGARVAMGAMTNDGNGSNSGHARVYEWAGESWTQLGADIDGEASNDFSGFSVSLAAAGDRLAIGAPGNDDNGTDSGHVRVYQWGGADWTQSGGDIDGGNAGDNFGYSVSLSANGNRLAIGAYEYDGENPGAGRGQVRIYQWSDSTWIPLGVPIDGEEEGDGFGHSVALSSNGNRVAASADRNEAGVLWSNVGHVRVYDLSMFSTFQINPGLNDHWYNPLTVGQGVYITVLPVLGKVTLTIFTYDTVLPPGDLTANLGDPSQRWLNAVGPYSGNQAVMNVSFDYDGIFDDPTVTTKVRGYGTIILTFDSCNSGTLEYEIPSLGLSGSVPIERIAGDNIALCEAFLAQ